MCPWILKFSNLLSGAFVRLKPFFFFPHHNTKADMICLFEIFVYLAVSGPGCSPRELHCDTWAHWLWCLASVVSALRLSCPMAYGVPVSSPWMKHTSPALQGGLPATGPPGKSLQCSSLALMVLKQW